MTMCLMGRSNHPVDLLGNTVSDDDVANDIVVTWPYKTEMTTVRWLVTIYAGSSTHMNVNKKGWMNHFGLELQKF